MGPAVQSLSLGPARVASPSAGMSSSLLTLTAMRCQRDAGGGAGRRVVSNATDNIGSADSHAVVNSSADAHTEAPTESSAGALSR